MRIHYIVRGVYIAENHLLLAREVGAPNTFLPGGHVEMRENAVDALTREIREELGLSAKVQELLGCVEHTWPDDAPNNHEINLAFKCEIPSLAPRFPPASREAHLEFLWVSIDELNRYNLLPGPMNELVAHITTSTSAFWASTIERQSV